MDDKMNKINDRIDDLKNDIKEVRKDTNDKIDCLNDRCSPVSGQRERAFA